MRNGRFQFMTIPAPWMLIAPIIMSLLLHQSARADWTPDTLASVVVALKTTRGQEWVQVRDAALARSNEDIAALLLHLARPQATEEEKSIEIILRTRRSQPDLTREYDESVTHSLNNPMRDILGRTMISLRPLTADSWGLGVEMLWKRSDLPKHLQRNPVHALPGSAMTLDPLLVLMRERPDLGGTLASALSQVPNASADPRVYPAMLEIYQYARTNAPETNVGEAIYNMGQAAGTLGCTASLGTPEALATVRQMQEFERALMTQRGLAPWLDQGQAEQAKRVAGDRKALVTVQQYPTAEERSQRIAEATTQLQEAMESWMIVTQWHNFERAYDTLRELGVPVDEPPSP